MVCTYSRYIYQRKCEDYYYIDFAIDFYTTSSKGLLLSNRSTTPDNIRPKWHTKLDLKSDLYYTYDRHCRVLQVNMGRFDSLVSDRIVKIKPGRRV